MRFALALLAMVLFTDTVEAQVFPNAFWNRTSSCAGSLTSGSRLFSGVAQRRANRIQSRTQTSGCSGLSASTQQTSLGCSGAMTTSVGCGGTVSYQQYVPSVVSYQQHAQVGNLVLNGGAPVQEAQQQVLAPVCDGPNCIIGPTQSTTPFPQSKPKNTTTSATTDGLFGLSASNDSLEIPNHILAQIAPNETFGLETTIPSHVLGQVDTQPVKVAESFKPALIKAISDARKSGKLTLRESVRLRAACLAPAFVERAHELAVTQMAFSGEASDAVPMSEEGVIQVEGINWEGLAKFLEVFVPLLINLLKAFGL